MTQRESAKKGIFTPLINKISVLEGIKPQVLVNRIKTGRIIILNNRLRKIRKPCAVGEGLRVKVNANLGTSSDSPSPEREIEKLEVAIRHGADAVMDLSTGGELKRIRKLVLQKSIVPVGTVPVYEIAVSAQIKRGNFLKFDQDDMLEVLEAQGREGVDFFTIHSGVTKKSLEVFKRNKRVLGIVSRGGALLAGWITRSKKENPFYEYFGRILDIAHKYDITLSLGDGLRPGSVLDATDKAQIAELRILGELAQEAARRDVQVLIEGPGHVPLGQVKENILLQKKYCRGAPFYVLGPLVTDVAAGYDHISSAIGGALAAFYGADFLCYVTPSEHLRHPSVEDVREGVIAARIAAHAADIAKGSRQALAWDRNMSRARKSRDWKRQIALAIDPDKAGCLRESSRPKVEDACTMCGEYCSIKVMQECVRA